MQQVPDTAPLPAPLHFNAVLRPHRSLGPRGFLIVMSLVGLVSFVAGLAFMLMGAWPVFGFFGLDVALIYLAFRLNYRSGRAFETVQLSDKALKVRKVDARGLADAWTFEPYWARVVFDAADEEDVAVELTSHGRRLVLGAFLSPEERVHFAEALRDELARHRTRAFPPVTA